MALFVECLFLLTVFYTVALLDKENLSRLY